MTKYADAALAGPHRVQFFDKLASLSLRLYEAFPSDAPVSSVAMSMGLSHNLAATPWHHAVGFPLMRVDSLDAFCELTDEQAQHYLPAIALTLLGFSPWGGYDQFWPLFFVSGRDRETVQCLAPELLSEGNNTLNSHRKRFDAVKLRMTVAQRDAMASFCLLYFGELLPSAEFPDQSTIAVRAVAEWR